MSLSRLALFAIATASALFTAATLYFPSKSAEAQQQIKLPDSPYTFTKIFEGRDIILETDASTYSAMLDADDDLMVAGIFRLIRKNAQASEKAVFISLTTAICGYDGVIILHSKDFTRDGKAAGEGREPQAIIVKPDTAAAATYISLCGSNTKPSKTDPSYKAPDRYTKFWT